MGQQAYVFSTLANDVTYVEYTRGASDLPIPGRQVLINGGTGVANKNIVTPLGVMTEIDADLVPMLESHPVFKVHADNGYVTIQKRSAEPEKVAADMNRKDKSAPLTPSDYENSGDGVAKPKLKT